MRLAEENPDAFLGYEDNIPVLEAESMLEKAKNGDIHLTVTGWKNLTLLVTGDEEQAEQAAYDYIQRCYERDEKPQL